MDINIRNILIFFKFNYDNIALIKKGFYMSKYKFIGTVYGDHRKDNVTYAYNKEKMIFDIKEVIGSDNDGAYLKILKFSPSGYEQEIWLQDIKQIEDEEYEAPKYFPEKGLL